MSTLPALGRIIPRDTANWPQVGQPAAGQRSHIVVPPAFTTPYDIHLPEIPDQADVFAIPSRARLQRCVGTTDGRSRRPGAARADAADDRLLCTMIQPLLQPQIAGGTSSGLLRRSACSTMGRTPRRSPRLQARTGHQRRPLLSSGAARSPPTARGRGSDRDAGRGPGHQARAAGPPRRPFFPYRPNYWPNTYAISSPTQRSIPRLGGLS